MESIVVIISLIIAFFLTKVFESHFIRFGTIGSIITAKIGVYIVFYMITATVLSFLLPIIGYAVLIILAIAVCVGIVGIIIKWVNKESEKHSNDKSQQDQNTSKCYEGNDYHENTHEVSKTSIEQKNDQKKRCLCCGAVVLEKNHFCMKCGQSVGRNKVSDELETTILKNSDLQLESFAESSLLSEPKEVEKPVEPLNSNGSNAAENNEKKDDILSCINCKSILKKNQKFCPKCGKKVVKICEKCGVIIKINGKFCSKCGMEV